MARAVSPIIYFKGKVLIGKKRSDSKKYLAGCWHIPGEGVKDGETDKDALVRGALEEVALDIEMGKYIDSSISPTSKREVRWYECFAKTDDITPGSDLEDAKFVPKNEVLNSIDKKAFDLIPENIKNYFKN